MITPKIHNHYVIHHSSGNIVARFISLREIPGYTNKFGNKMRNATTHYHFTNLKTGREIILKSRAKIRREVTFDSPEHLTENQVLDLERNW